MKRRTFLANTAAAGAAALMNTSSAFASEKLMLKNHDTILFQGDSITDAAREKQNPMPNSGLGDGYPAFVAASLHQDYPTLDLQIQNRGISGNRVPDLDKRWQRDAIEIKPRVLSILIGVNDIWHKLSGRYDGTAEVYRDGLAALLKRTAEALPDTLLVVCDPFVLMAGSVKENKDKWFPEFDTRRRFAYQVAESAGTIWVPFQKAFDQAVADGASPESLAGDGVHPTTAGHRLMAQTWRQAVGI